MVWSSLATLLLRELSSLTLCAWQQCYQLGVDAIRELSMELELELELAIPTTSKSTSKCTSSSTSPWGSSAVPSSSSFEFPARQELLERPREASGHCWDGELEESDDDFDTSDEDFDDTADHFNGWVLRMNPIEIDFKSLDILIAFWAKPATAYLQIALSTSCLKVDSSEYQVSTLTQNLEHSLIVKSCFFSVFNPTSNTRLVGESQSLNLAWFLATIRKKTSCILYQKTWVNGKVLCKLFVTIFIFVEFSLQRTLLKVPQHSWKRSTLTLLYWVGRVTKSKHLDELGVQRLTERPTMGHQALSLPLHSSSNETPQ